MLLPGITVNPGPTDLPPVKQTQMPRFDARDLPDGARRPTRKRLDRALHGAVGVGIAAGVLVLLGFVRFAIPPSPETGLAQTDAIVVLTGGSSRLRSGIELMREGKGRTLFVSGVEKRVEIEELLYSAGEQPPPWLLCCVVLGHEAENTFGNALETAQWMRRQGYHSLRLVTSWYHMPRSRLEFERAMPDVEIVPHPVFPEQLNPQHWWAWRGTAALLIGEYGKYLVVLFRPFMEWPEPVGPQPIEAELKQ
jgi:uncharacterized SAM-binding protein YcdF (DUF218 family)